MYYLGVFFDMIVKKLLKLVLISCFLSAFWSCSKDHHSHLTYENDVFSILYPDSVRLSGYSNGLYRGGIVLNGSDTLFYTIGYIVANLSEENKEVLFIPKEFENNIDSSFISDKSIVTNRRHFDLDRYRTQNITIEKEGKVIRKYTYPIEVNSKGLVGLYIDSIGWSDKGVIQFNLFSQNLVADSLLMGILKSVRIKYKPVSFYDRSTYVY